MDESSSVETNSQKSECTTSEKSVAGMNESRQMAPNLGNLCQVDYNEVPPKTVHTPEGEQLLPVRMTIGSQYYAAAFRLDESNVCAEAVEAILFDSWDGEFILAEYQQNNCLSSTTQQKLTDLLLTRSSKSLIGAKHIQNYFVKLTDAIVKLMPNEDPNVYYIPPQSNGNDSKNPKGKLPDKWRNLTYQLRTRGILPKKKVRDKPTNAPELSSSSSFSTAQSVRAAVDTHMKQLQMSKEPLSQLIVDWDATLEYRKIVRSTLNNLDDVLYEWPVLKTDKGPHLIDYEFKNLFGHDNVMDKWTSFFNALYDIKKSSITYGVAKEYCNMYESSIPQVVAGIQILLLPFFIKPTSKFKTGSGITVKPSMIESSEGFVIYCTTTESISAKILSRSDRYRNWNMPVQPCIVLRGPQPCIIEAAYVSLQEQLWEVDSPLRALDLAFKLYQVFNLHYPADCEQIWLVVQKMVYEINKPSDKKINNVTSLTNMLNVKLQNKRQRTE